MSGGHHGLYILAAYGVALGLIAAEVWTLVRRSRGSSKEPLDEA